ncbi:hypothetical protein IP88_02520, partial [alpha proteobacterium AAP81b]
QAAADARRAGHAAWGRHAAIPSAAAIDAQVQRSLAAAGIACDGTRCGAAFEARIKARVAADLRATRERLRQDLRLADSDRAEALRGLDAAIADLDRATR